jgi:hypothetical protein
MHAQMFLDFSIVQLSSFPFTPKKREGHRLTDVPPLWMIIVYSVVSPSVLSSFALACAMRWL